jgi:hypothetical protein
MQANAIGINRICIDLNGDVTVYWENNSDTCDDFIGVNVYGKDNVSVNFSKLNTDTISDYSKTFYYHESNGSNLQNWTYYVEFIYDCGGTITLSSSIESIDKTQPEKCEIDTVSVDNEKVSISWKKSISKDVKYYIIYYVQSNDINQNIDTVYYYEDLFYIDSITGKPRNKSENYRIVAVDSCDNFSEISKKHNTIFISANQNYCSGTVQISWNHYDSWNFKDREYDILRDNRIIDNVNGSISNYTFSDLDNNTEYCFEVRCRNKVSGYTSTSNLACITTNFIENPEYVYLIMSL